MFNVDIMNIDEVIAECEFLLLFSLLFWHNGRYFVGHFLKSQNWILKKFENCCEFFSHQVLLTFCIVIFSIILYKLQTVYISSYMEKLPIVRSLLLQLFYYVQTKSEFLLLFLPVSFSFV